MYVQIVNTGNYKLISIGKVTSPLTCLNKWEKIAARISKDDGGKYDFTLETSIIYIQLQADLITIKSCLSRLITTIPFVNKPTIEILNDLGYSIDISSKDAYISSIANADRKSNNLLNRLRSMEVRLSTVINQTTERKEISLGDMITTVNVSLGANYVTHDTPLELYFNYRSIAKKKIESLNKKANG